MTLLPGVSWRAKCFGAWVPMLTESFSSSRDGKVFFTIWHSIYAFSLKVADSGIVRADTAKRVPLGFGLFFLFVCFQPYLAVCGTQLGIKPVPPAVKVQGLNHWATREVHPFGLGKLFVHRTISPSHETQSWTSSEKRLQFLDPSPCVVGLVNGRPRPFPNRASSEERGCGPPIC